MTRTCDLRFRKPPLYPAELRDRKTRKTRSRFSRGSIAEPPPNRKPLSAAEMSAAETRAKAASGKSRPAPVLVRHSRPEFTKHLFLVDDVLEHEARELGHQRPQPGVFLQQLDHVRIHVRVETVVLVPNSRCGNWIPLLCGQIHISHDRNSWQLNPAESGQFTNQRSKGRPSRRRN